MRKNSIKNTRVNGEVQRELSNIILTEIKDPRIHTMTSVVKVEVTPDLKMCKAYISVLGTDEQKKDTIDGLKSAQGFIKNRIAKVINLRNTPELKFVLDNSLEYSFKISKIINDINSNSNSNDSLDANE